MKKFIFVSCLVVFIPISIIVTIMVTAPCDKSIKRDIMVVNGIYFFPKPPYIKILSMKQGREFKVAVEYKWMYKFETYSNTIIPENYVGVMVNKETKEVIKTLTHGQYHIDLGMYDVVYINTSKVERVWKASPTAGVRILPYLRYGPMFN